MLQRKCSFDQKWAEKIFNRKLGLFSGKQLVVNVCTSETGERRSAVNGFDRLAIGYSIKSGRKG